MDFFAHKAGEKAVEGGFDCLKHWIGGNNAVKLEQVKMKRELVEGALAIGGIATFLYGTYRIIELAADKADKFINNKGKFVAEAGWGKAQVKINIEGGKN